MENMKSVQKSSRLVHNSPVFYGWVIWGVATLGLLATSPGQSFSVSLFIDHYIADFNLSRTYVSGLYGVGTFLSALSLTWVGQQIDRHGNRLVSTLIAGLFSIALLACSLLTGPLSILISFIAIRGLGQGSLGLASSTSIAEWFQARRGFVMGLSIVVFALFQRLYLPWLQRTIDIAGWRQTWMFLGGGMALIVLPLTWLLMRDRPEDFGLQPDGGKNAEKVDTLQQENNFTLPEAMHTSIFWIFIAGRALSSGWGTGLIFHQVSIFQNLGHTPLVSAETYGTAALVTAASTLLSGWLVDRLRPSIIMAMQLTGLALANILASVMAPAALLIVYAAAFGFFMGVGSVFDGTVWVTLYGRKHQGTIRGFVSTALVIGTSIGPFLFGLCYDSFGNYDIVLWTGAVLSAVLILLSLRIKKGQLLQLLQKA